MEVGVEEVVAKLFDEADNRTFRLEAQQLTLDGCVRLLEQLELFVARVLLYALLVSICVHLLSDELEQDAQAGDELFLVVRALELC